MRIAPLAFSCFAALLASPFAFAAGDPRNDKPAEASAAAPSASASTPPSASSSPAASASASPSASAAAPAPAAPEADEGPDEVLLKDGTSLRGKVLRQDPGTAVVVRLRTGRVRTVAWEDVKHVDASDAPPVRAAATPTFAPSGVGDSSVDRAESPRSESAARAPVIGEIGFRTGYALASGDVAQNQSLTQTVNGFIPAIVDVGVRPVPFLYLGAFAQYGVLSTNQCGTAASDCSGSDVRVGVQIAVHANPEGKVDPWFAYAFGHEWLNLSAKGAVQGAPVSVDAQFTGWTPLELLAGVDIRANDTFVLAPYGGLTLGTYDSGSFSASGGGASQSGSADISATSSHMWITFGLRGAFALGGNYPKPDVDEPR